VRYIGSDFQMKKRDFTMSARPGGILRWSTFCLLAGGAAALTSCERSEVTEEDVRMAAAQTQVESLDAAKSQLLKGEVENNFHLPRVGYYHSPARAFFEHPYGFEKDARFFANGAWIDFPPPTPPATSRPTPEALARVDAALADEQKLAAKPQQGGGFGMGSALMMYWMLSGNRGMVSPGAGFRQAETQAGNWQRGVESQRGAVAKYAASNPGYQRMVERSKASGKPIAAGQSVRGGFGSKNSGGTSFGS
jgi:hypothetical protein